MSAAMLADAAIRCDDESAELLRWFEGGAMTQLGHEWRTRAGKAQDRLGVCASSSSQLLSPEALDAAFAWFDKGGRAPLLIRSEERRVGKECVSTCGHRWSPGHSKKKKKEQKRGR